MACMAVRNGFKKLSRSHDGHASARAILEDLNVRAPAMRTELDKRAAAIQDLIPHIPRGGISATACL